MANEIRHVRVGGTTYDIVGRVEGVRLSVSEGASASGSAQVASDGTLDLSLTLPRAQGGTGATGSAQQADKSKLLSGLRIVVCGDSLFSGVNTRPMSEWLKDYGATADNLSSNGATLAAKDRSGSGQTSHNSIMEQTWSVPQGDCDLVLIDGFNNDFGFADIDGIRFGTYMGTGASGEPDTTTFCGAMEKAVDNLFMKRVKILFVFPYRMADEPNQVAWHGRTKEGHTLEDYRDVTLGMCEDYGVTPVRLDHTSLNGLYDWQRELLFAADEGIQNKSWANDGVHPGAEAHRQFIMPVVVDAIRRVTGV